MSGKENPPLTFALSFCALPILVADKWKAIVPWDRYGAWAASEGYDYVFFSKPKKRPQAGAINTSNIPDFLIWFIKPANMVIWPSFARLPANVKTVTAENAFEISEALTYFQRLLSAPIGGIMGDV